MRIVIVGASGNVGTALLRRLAADSSLELSGVSRRIPPADASPYAGVRWTACDLAEDSTDVLRRCFAGTDVVVHLAWQIQPSHRPHLLHRANVEGSRQVFTAAVEAGVGHIVYASSVGVYAADSTTLRRDESWPTTGLTTSSYSRHKVAVERILDQVEANSTVVVSRLRPALIFQHDAGAEIARLFVGPLVPTSALLHVRPPVVPLPRHLRLHALHADDAADAYARVIQRRAAGAFNLAAEPVLDRDTLAAVIGGRPVELSPRLFRALAAAAWSARLQPTEPGWLDLAMASPLLESGRAAQVLEWQPRISATDALRDLLAGMAEGAGTQSPAMRRRDPASVRLSGLVRGRVIGSTRRP